MSIKPIAKQVLQKSGLLQLNPSKQTLRSAVQDQMDQRVEEREGRRRRRRKAEGSTEPLATISRRVEEEEEVVEEDKKEEEEEEGKRRRGKPSQQHSVDEGGDIIVRKRRAKKKTSKRESNIGIENEENYEEKKTKLKKRRKKRQVSLSSQDDYEGEVGKSEKEKKKKRKSTGGAHGLREELYADPQLVTTLQGLEDDMFSLSGEGDMTTLSPSPLIPPLPPSQPVAKIYLERGGGFAKTSVAALSAVTTFSALANSEKQQSPLGLGLATQRIFRSLAIFAHGLLAGLAGWQVFMVYSLHEHDLQFISLYSPLAQPLQLIFYLLTVICTVSVCDRYDVAEFSLTGLQRMLTLRSGGISVLVYWATLLLTLVTTRVDDKLSLFQHNATLFTDMEEEERSYELETWKAMNLARGLAVILGWLLVALRPNTDLLYKNLRSSLSPSLTMRCQHACIPVFIIDNRRKARTTPTEMMNIFRKLERGEGRGGKKEAIETIKMP